jgi:ATP-dependent Zn protease
MTKLLKLILLAALLVAPGLTLAACPPTGDIDIAQLSTQATSISFDSDNRGKTITAFGTVKNNSQLCAQEITVEVKYFDSKGAQVDVTTQTLALSIGPGQETAFRVRDDASKEKEAYASSTMRIISVEPLFGRAVKNATPWWFDCLVSWLPMLVFLSIFIVFMRRMLGKNSPQFQSLALVKRQQETLERIAVALEKRTES